MDNFKIAIIVDPALPLGLLANTVATLAIGIGAAAPIFGGTALTDQAGRTVSTSANRPVPILQAPAEQIGALLLKALPDAAQNPDGRIIVPFPQFARAVHSFEDYLALFPQQDLARAAIDGLALAGPEKWLRSLTGNLKLLR